MIFTSRADVDMRYVAVREMGRTVMGPLDNTVFDQAGNMVKLGENQIGRYAIHFHHDFGPVATPANGYQFTLIGNVVDAAPKWGITIHNSHYGLVKDNVVYNAQGAGIVTEDGNESFNVFDHNFALRVKGSGEFAPRSGYGGPGPIPAGKGTAFWFRGPEQLHPQQRRPPMRTPSASAWPRAARRRSASRRSRAPIRTSTRRR